MKRIAFYGGSFDPVHNGHLAIAKSLSELFALDEFWFVPAFHAPHKREKKVSSAFCRYAMLALATNGEPRIKISTIELDAPEKPFTIDTLTEIKSHYGDRAEIFFVMGADSWNEINTWHGWEKLLLLTNHIVVTRPDFEIETAHVTPEIKARITDLRKTKNKGQRTSGGVQIFITDAVQLDISSTAIRADISSQNNQNWRNLIVSTVADYIEKYKLYSYQSTDNNN